MGDYCICICIFWSNVIIVDVLAAPMPPQRSITSHAVCHTAVVAEVSGELQIEQLTEHLYGLVLLLQGLESLLPREHRLALLGLGETHT